MKKSKMLFAVFGLCLIIFATGFVSTKNVYGLNSSPYITCSSSARAMCVLEQKSGRILIGKNINQHLAMASTTKIFTALTVLENCDNLEAKVNVDDRAVGIEGTSIFLRKGEILTVKELMYGMMLPSGNDAATALAYYIGGDIPIFCKMMETTAKNAGAYNSSFKNPHGLDEDGHYTTAYDLAKVCAKALENEVFYEISTTKSTVISGNNEVKSRYLKNKNKLLKSFEGCNGVKTGFTDNAGRCFVSSATRENMTIVCCVLNCPDMFDEASRLMQKAFDLFDMTNLVEAYSVLKDIDVVNGREKSVKVFSREEFFYPLTDDEKLQINIVLDLPENLIAPIKKEQIVGILKVYLKDDLLFEDEILTREEVRKNSVFSYVKDVLKKWL